MPCDKGRCTYHLEKLFDVSHERDPSFVPLSYSAGRHIPWRISHPSGVPGGSHRASSSALHARRLRWVHGRSLDFCAFLLSKHVEVSYQLFFGAGIVPLPGSFLVRHQGWHLRYLVSVQADDPIPFVWEKEAVRKRTLELAAMSNWAEDRQVRDARCMGRFMTAYESDAC